MSLDAIRTMLRRAGVTNSQLGVALGIDRSTVNKLLHGVYPMRPVYDYAIRWHLAQLDQSPRKLAVRRKRNLLIPKAVAEKKCPECGRDLDFPCSRGIRRRGVRCLVYPARCKTHQMDPAACSVTTIYLDKDGNQIEVPKFAPRDPKPLPYVRPSCPQCGLHMELGKMATMRTTTSKGEVRDEKVQGFDCVGGRWGKPKHKANTVYCNSKGGQVQVAKGKHKKLSELPIGLRRNYPKCPKCGKPVARQVRPYITKKWGRIWWFRCRACRINRGFYDSGKPHLPHEGRRIRPCPECGEDLVKAKEAEKFSKCQAYVCRNYAVPHKPRKFYVHLQNGRMYIAVGRGSHWELKAVQAETIAAELRSDISTDVLPPLVQG